MDRRALVLALVLAWGLPLAAAALHYVLAHPAVTAGVIGVRSAQRVRANAEYLETSVPRELFDELAADGLIAPLVAEG